MMFGLSEIAVYDKNGNVVRGVCPEVYVDGYTKELSVVVDGFVIDRLYYEDDFEQFVDEEDWYGYMCWYVASDRYARSVALIS